MRLDRQDHVNHGDWCDTAPGQGTLEPPELEGAGKSPVWVSKSQWFSTAALQGNEPNKIDNKLTCVETAAVWVCRLIQLASVHCLGVSTNSHQALLGVSFHFHRRQKVQFPGVHPSGQVDTGATETTGASEVVPQPLASRSQPGQSPLPCLLIFRKILFLHLFSHLPSTIWIPLLFLK